MLDGEYIFAQTQRSGFTLQTLLNRGLIFHAVLGSQFAPEFNRTRFRFNCVILIHEKLKSVKMHLGRVNLSLSNFFNQLHLFSNLGQFLNSWIVNFVVSFQIQLVFPNLTFSLECVWSVVRAIKCINIRILSDSWCHPFILSPLRILCFNNRWCRSNVWRRREEHLSTRYLVNHLNIMVRKLHTCKPIGCFPIHFAIVCRDGFQVLIQ